MSSQQVICIVTVKLSKIGDHNPNDKKTGKCRLHLYSNSKCTDVTGEHHSTVMQGKSIQEIKKRAEDTLGHVTRIERIHNVIFLESY